MNFTRLSIAAVAAWVAYVGLGFLLYQGLLEELWAREADLFRPLGERRFGPGLLASFGGLFVFTYAYAKGYEGGDGVQEGLRYGVLVGLLVVCFGTVWMYAAMPMSGTLALYLGLGTVLELTVSGIVVGWIYQPATAPGRRRPGG